MDTIQTKNLEITHRGFSSIMVIIFSLIVLLVLEPAIMLAVFAVVAIIGTAIYSYSKG